MPPERSPAPLPDPPGARVRLLDLTLGEPGENLALDEALLIESERSGGGEWLRFWESERPFVVLGVSARLAEDVDAEACARDGVPVLRRASGGGTVLQGPGCLNYSLVLSLAARPELRQLHASYAAILERTARGLDIESVRRGGTSDLALGERKFSGSAQKRARAAILHHGTVLYRFDLEAIARYLREPEKQPEYRRRRAHGEFLENLPLPAAEIKRRIALAWGASPGPEAPPLALLPELIERRYASREWTERF